MRTLVLILLSFVGSITLATAQSTDESRADQLDAQIETLKESLDTIDIAKLFEQFSLPFGNEARPSDKTLQELENGMDQMLGMMDKIDISAVESIIQSFIGEMDTMLDDFDMPKRKDMTPIPDTDIKEPTDKREIKKL
jgi:hypothetical protein